MHVGERGIEGVMAGATSEEVAANGEEGVAEDVGVDEQALICLPSSLLDISVVVLLKRCDVVPCWAKCQRAHSDYS